MIDIHCHILPGIDDGPKAIDESLAMLRMAAADGIRTIVATPHWGGPYEETSPTLVRSLVARVNELASEHDLPVEVLPGCEARMDPALPNQACSGELLTLGDRGRYVLVEVLGPPVPLYALEVHFELRLAGFTPILAHAERLLTVPSAWSFTKEFVDQGGLVQVNASALGGEEGRAVRNRARRLFREGLAQVIASDGHGTEQRRPVLTQCLGAFPRRDRDTVLERYCSLELGRPD